MDIAENIAQKDPAGAFQLFLTSSWKEGGEKHDLDGVQKQWLREALIARFSVLKQEFKEFDMLKQFRAIAFTACALVGQPTIVAVAANFFNFKIEKKTDKIKKTIQQELGHEREVEIVDVKEIVKKTHAKIDNIQKEMDKKVAAAKAKVVEREMSEAPQMLRERKGRESYLLKPGARINVGGEDVVLTAEILQKWRRVAVEG